MFFFSDLKVVNIFLSFGIILYKSEFFKFCDIEWNLVERRFLIQTDIFITCSKGTCGHMQTCPVDQLVYLTEPSTCFLTAILHRGLRNDFFFSFFFNTDLLFPIFIWTFLSHLYLDFSFPFPFGLFFPFSIWTFISLFYMDAPIFSFLLKFFSFLFKFFQFVSIRSIRFNSFYIQSRSHFGFLPNFFLLQVNV